MKPNKIERVHMVVDRLLGFMQSIYNYFTRLIRRSTNMSLIYSQIDSMIRAQLITIDKDMIMMDSPNLSGLTETITHNVLEKIPNVDENTVKQFIERSTSATLIDILTRGKEPSPYKEYTYLKKRKLFKKILIANRGEIALRIIRACKELNIKTAVIYTKPDKDTLAVKFADQSFCISSDDISNSYLNIKKIIKVAKKAKCDAIHPGYGFLSENSEFTRLCEKNKITFIGPSYKSMELMGNKVKARSLMIENNIPVISGTRNPLSDEQTALIVAEKIGYPVILKATTGGGGKGMRVVRNREEVIPSFNAAKLEAKASFGKDSLFLEKYVEDPRHIEFQILADKYGHVIHLGERECTIQRRHQKLIEEAPSPALTRQLREEMGRIAVNIARLASYEGAGTVEFLLDKDKKFYFMEMNTRIQVEHGVTEMITNVDLIKEQIKLASGAKLTYRQEDIKFDRCAIECRINAESPYEDFKPSPGTISEYLPPGGPGIRICSSCHSGYKISPHYDSLVSKLMCLGETRQEAIDKMKRALNEYIIEGVETTIPFHIKVLSNNKFISGEFTTSFIDDEDILKTLKKPRSRKKQLTQEKKMLLVSTAVSKYFEKNDMVRNKNKAWSNASKYELINDNQPGEMF